MNADPFTEAAVRHFDESYDIARLPMPGTLAVEMAEWARTHLAAQEPTDAECVAVLDVKYGGPVGPHDEPYDAEEMAEARAALSAARAARRDEEKR